MTKMKSDKETERSNAIKKANKCLEFINLYSDLSIYRMLLITDMASLFSSSGLERSADNLLFLTQKEKVSDKEVLMFLFDPINN